MDLLAQTANSLWQVVLVGLLLGAGLPAIFALGLKSLSMGAQPGPDGQASTLGKLGAALCFAVVLIAIIAGILMLMQNFLASSFGIHVF
ncbi:hypothetical protein AB4Z09_03385 [Rhodococcus sp. TAF43]|uniref:hypothetical protein n=1 Tax=unclassified Rhodococcus (in: high G+C Gram-positive bacteria) TaxID=192944 RepID=UPI0015843847|nr:hypothetical protein [Rhodococcus sp. W8901]QKT12901.1 hypothetical protein HUN07_21235 [Rhodococcus sp. W8901]